MGLCILSLSKTHASCHSWVTFPTAHLPGPVGRLTLKQGTGEMNHREAGLSVHVFSFVGMHDAILICWKALLTLFFFPYAYWAVLYETTGML